MYSVFFPFFQQISNITQYNAAYYSALSSVERGLLVLKYRSPGFEWSGGFIWSTTWWPKSDAVISFLTGNAQGSSRQISSRTSRIPLSGMGNTDSLLQSGDSSSYNVMGYTSLEVIPLSFDATTSGEQYYGYTWTDNIVYFSGSDFTGILRLPRVVYSAFGNTIYAWLCDAAAEPYNCDLDQDDMYDEVKVNRWLAWTYAGISFKLFSVPDIFYYSGMQVNEPFDSTIRASRINNLATYILPLSFWNSFSPLLVSSSLTEHNSISATGTVKQMTFHDIFVSPEVSWLQLSLWLISLLRSQKGDLYPYLEYSFSFPQPVSNTYYLLDAHGRNRSYDVQIIIKKPTTDKSIGGDFTVIF